MIRDALAAKMTPQQVAAAQELARSWRPGGGGSAVAAEAAGTAGSTGATVAAPAPAAATAPSPAPDAGAPPRAIREAQALLAGLGYAPGPADGLWGRRTGQAYRAFLRDAGLPAAERLTPEALRAMRAIAKRRGVETGSAATAARAAPEAPRASSGVSAPRAPAAVAPDALHRAAQAGDIAGLEAALAAGVDVDARDGRGWTALMHAVNKGYTLLVEPLLKADANPDVRAPDGATALFMAAVHGHTEVIVLLMEAGADTSIQGPQDRKPLEVARLMEHSSILALPEMVALLEAEARKEREKAAHKKHEEDSEAFSRAKSLGTRQAYLDYLSSYCPEGDFCGTAHTRLDEVTKTSVAGKAFRGKALDSGGRQSYRFSPSRKFTGRHFWPGSFIPNSMSGTWRVEDGRIRMDGRTGLWAKWTAIAEWDGNVLWIRYDDGAADRVIEYAEEEQATDDTAPNKIDEYHGR